MSRYLKVTAITKMLSQHLKSPLNHDLPFLREDVISLTFTGIIKTLFMFICIAHCHALCKTLGLRQHILV